MEIRFKTPEMKDVNIVADIIIQNGSLRTLGILSSHNGKSIFYPLASLGQEVMWRTRESPKDYKSIVDLVLPSLDGFHSISFTEHVSFADLYEICSVFNKHTDTNVSLSLKLVSS